MDSVLRIILTAMVMVLGPAICYIAVYGFSFLVKYAILLIKAKRFQKRMKIANANLDSDLADISVEIISSKDIQNMKSEKKEHIGIENENTAED